MRFAPEQAVQSGRGDEGRRATNERVAFCFAARIRALRTPWLAVSVTLLLTSFSSAQTASMRGFLLSDVPGEQRLEQQVQAIPNTERLRQYMDFNAAEPHNAGSPRSKVVAEHILGLLKEWGLDAHIEEFEALLPFPTVRQVEVMGPKPYTAKLKEPAIAQDPDSGEAHQLPTYNAYGATGDVTGGVVYVNYGVPEDYDWLDKEGISVTGKIVIARYGKSWRGIKPKVAAEHGAIACLIYSDPQQSGYFQGDPYPKGPMQPAEGVQRGSVMDMPFYPGDPLSPGWASEKGSKRLPISQAATLMKIPVLPLSYADAQPILEQLTGPVVPEDWRGALPFTYHAGPGATTVHIKTDYDWSSKPVYDVIATIPGAALPDQWVIAGNHHDAWVNGADDPVSGSVALMETARSLATLVKSGWKPKRTVKIAFWGAEEFGMIGSTEWVEKHQDELKQKAVVYFNSDDTGRGWIQIGATHTLEEFLTEVAGSIQQPGTDTNLADYALHHPPAEDDDSQPAAKKDRTFHITALGSGSDFVPFLDYLGVASTNEEFGGQSNISGVYHSIYDSIYWYTHFSDGTFVDGRALSQFTGTALLRMANAAVLPFEFGHFTKAVNRYLDEIQNEAQRGGKRLDFTALRKQLSALDDNSDRYEANLQAATLKPSLDTAHLRALNADLLQAQLALTKPRGLPNRWWYKNQIYAPGFYTGYGVKTLPGIREAVDSKNWTLAQEQAGVVEQCLSQMTQMVGRAADQAAGL